MALQRVSRRMALILAAIGVALCPAAASAQEGTGGTPPGAQAGPSLPPLPDEALEPRALELLKAASGRLAAAKTMAFTAEVLYESPSRLGPPLVYATKSSVVLQRPDKLRILTPADGPPSEFYYDGKEMVAYAPDEDLVAVAEAPPTIDGALEAAYRSADIYFPFTDVISADPYREISQGLQEAFVVGQSRVIGDTTTDIVAYANDYVFVQIWIGTSDKLPRMLRAVFLEDPSRLRHTLLLSDWQLDGAVPPETFRSERAKAAKPIPFARPAAKPSAGGPPGAQDPPARPESGGPES